MRLYNQTVDTYDLRYQEEQAKKYKAVLEALCLKKGSHILDVGCGTGLFIRKIVDIGCQIVCIDFSEKMMREAKSKCGNNQEFICADADFLPFLGETFDNVFSFTLIQNMPFPERTISEMSRVAKLGSEVILSAPKKLFKNLSFSRLLNGPNLSLVKFISLDELKDYIAVCRKTDNFL